MPLTPHIVVQSHSPDTWSIIQPIVDVLEHFILKCADSLRVVPPIIPAEFQRIKSDYADDAFAAERAMQHPAHAACREDFRWHNDAACIVALRPGSQGEHLLMRVRQGVAEDFDCACGHPE